MPETAFNLELLRLIDELHLQYPFYGSRRITDELIERKYLVNRKRVSRLMRIAGIEAIYPKPKTTEIHPAHKKYPYLLANMRIVKPNQVWCADITYIPMASGFLYLVAVMDWYSRFVLSWSLSNSLQNDFCVNALEAALSRFGVPEIFNTDQGVQFTSLDFVRLLEAENISISMDGKGRAFDNIFIERLWRSVKYEEVYLKAYESGRDANDNIRNYFDFYDYKRKHQSLGRRTPFVVYSS